MANIDEAPEVEIDRDPAVPPLTEEHLQALRQTIQGARLRAFWRATSDEVGRDQRRD